MPGILCIYHAECLDGFSAAWVCREKYPDSVMIPARYGDEIPKVDGKDVILVDFCYTRNIIESMLKVANSILILDHHKTARERLDGLNHPKLKAVFDDNKSGAGITWDYFFPNAKRPVLIDRVEDNDLWRFKYDDTRAFVEALRSFEPSVESIDLIHRLLGSVADYNEFVKMGRNIRAFKDKLVDQTVSQAHEIDFDGHKVWAANALYYLSSDVANRLIRDRPFGVTYYEDDKNRWHISLRSNDFDVAKFAEKLGGGGHHNSAGITLDKLPWK